jgi:hypothetical protein
MQICRWLMILPLGLSTSATAAGATIESPDVTPSPADPWRRHAVEVSIGLGSPVGFAGIVYNTPALGPLWLQAGIGWGASGMLLSTMPKIALYRGQACRIGFGAGAALGISPLAILSQPGPVSAWLDVDLFNVECRRANGRAFSFGFGFTRRLTEDRPSDDEDGLAEEGNAGPQLHFGFGNTF